MKRPLAVALVLAAVAVGLPATGGAAVIGGKITPNRGAKGIRLGMTRTEVLARLGSPVYKNANGYLQYGPNNKPVLFDVYLDVAATPDRVRLIGISGAGFCLAGGGPCLDHAGGVGDLKDRYGDALKIVRLEDGERVYRLTGMLGGCDVFTDFTPVRFRPSSRILMVFIGYLGGAACGA